MKRFSVAMTNVPVPMITKFITDARDAWKLLHGVFVLYKPASVHMKTLSTTLRNRLCEDLNQMDVRPLKSHISIEGETNKELKVIVKPSYADHPLIIGPRYIPDDIKIRFVNLLSKDTSGVIVGGINEGVKHAYKIFNSKPTRFYKIKGILGQATDNYFKTGKIVEKSTYKHIKRGAIDRLCASIQSSHQRKMFELSGFDMQSQSAYDLAVKGLFRPADNNLPVIYAIKCTNFESPEFTIEIVCINEYEMYLKTLIHDIGMKLQSVATCTHIQCYQFGLFTLEHALLKKHWELQYIVDNIIDCKKIISANQYLLKQENANLIEDNT